MRVMLCFLLVAALSASASATALDGLNIPSEGLTLQATQDTPTGFGNAIGGGQDSAGGSELNQLFADIDGDTLKLGITGNLEANFNKMFIFFDGVPGGETTLAADNADGGFGEINALAGLSFGGRAMDHAIRLEVGGGFLGIRYADLIDNVGGDIYTAGGTGSLPLSTIAGGQGVSLGWDNSNVDGVDDSSAALASTATKGFEFEIDMPTFFGSSPDGVFITALITSGDATFVSNQVLPGIGGGGNIGAANGVDLRTVLVGIPEPSAVMLAGLAAAAALGLRRRLG